MNFAWKRADKDGNLSGRAGRQVHATIAPDGRGFVVNVFRIHNGRQVCAIMKAGLASLDAAKAYAEDAYELVKPR